MNIKRNNNQNRKKNKKGISMTNIKILLDKYIDELFNSKRECWNTQYGEKIS